MATRRGNPNWGKPEMAVPPPISEFERVTCEFNLQPDEYLTSTRLREWASRNKKKVFVVDDEEPIAEVLTLGLRNAELDVETFNDARSALLRARDCPPDALVSDISMPEMDGITLAKALRKQYPNCKVILISGNPGWKTREDWRGDGLDGFVLLPKPFALSQLLSLIKSDES
jgi:DNA-binding NtrC family response regulator